MSGAFLGAWRFPALIVLPLLFAVVARFLPLRGRSAVLVLAQAPCLLLLGIPARVGLLYVAMGMIVGVGLALMKRVRGVAVTAVRWSLVACLLGLLAVLKYEWVTVLLHLESEILDVSSPSYWGLFGGTGVSYLTFRLLAVALDGGADQPRPCWLQLAAFSTFAPCSVAGPIYRLNDFLRDLREPAPLTTERALSGLTRLVVGLAKTVIVGGTASLFALGQVPLEGSPWRLVAASLMYSVYIYFDFSGYTDMAIGWARLFGFRLPENFDRPYLAEDLQEFWNRWHMTLSLWFKRYLFYPLNLALTRYLPRGRRLRNPVAALLVTFVLVGLWHGDGLGYAVFGLLHGLGVAIGGPKGFRPASVLGLQGAVARFTNRALTLGYVSLCWIPFVYSPSELQRQFAAGTSDLLIR